MITSGNVTVHVSDMDRAVNFYTNTLRLTLGSRLGNHWAEVRVGQSLVIGLHPRSEHGPTPGTAGAMSIGLAVDEAIEEVVRKLTAKGVQFHGPIKQDGGGLSLAFFSDQDGNPLYLSQVATSWSR